MCPGQPGRKPLHRPGLSRPPAGHYHGAVPSWERHRVRQGPPGRSIAGRDGKSESMSVPPMRPAVVHLVLGKSNPDRANGVNRLVHQLAAHQIGSGQPAAVWGLTSDPTAPTPPRPYPLRLFRAAPARLAPAPDLRQAIAALDPERTVLHLHGGLIPEFLAASLLFRRYRLRFVLTPHGAYSPFILARRRWLKSAYLETAERVLLSGAAAVHLSHEAEIAPRVAAMVRTGRIRAIPNGHAPLPEEAAPTRLDPAPMLVYCGRLDIQVKGLDLLIEGLARHRRGGGRARLAIVGDGPDAGELARRVEDAGLAGAVEFHGFVPEPEKRRLIRLADAFVLTSRSEGMPMSAIEAAALGRPLLISRETNLAGLVEAWRAGWVLPANTAEAIALAVDDVVLAVTDGRALDRGRQAGSMARTEFSWDRIVERINRELYEPALGWS